MKKDMPLEGLRWSHDSGSAIYDTPQTTILGSYNIVVFLTICISYANNCFTL